MARQKTRLQKISFVTGHGAALLALAGLSLSPLSGFIEMPIRTVVSAIAPGILAALQFLVPCPLGHVRLLEFVLQVTTCGWRVFLAFTGAA